MAGANNIAGSDDSDPQFVIIFVHSSVPCSLLQTALVVVELGLTAASNCAFNAKSDGLGIP